MILIDTGPLVAIFRRSETHHRRCVERLSTLGGPFATTLPVVTEAFHLLGPASAGAGRLRAFIRLDGASLVDLSGDLVERAFALMEEFSDLPMDFADASVVASAEALGTLKIFTLDLRDFGVYRIRRGRKRYAPNLV